VQIFIGRSARSPFFEIAIVLVRLDHVASFVVKAAWAKIFVR
jgi:hypothetical protein